MQLYSIVSLLYSVWIFFVLHFTPKWRNEVVRSVFGTPSINLAKQLFLQAPVSDQPENLCLALATYTIHESFTSSSEKGNCCREIQNCLYIVFCSALLWLWWNYFYIHVAVCIWVSYPAQPAIELTIEFGNTISDMWVHMDWPINFARKTSWLAQSDILVHADQISSLGSSAYDKCFITRARQKLL